MLVLIIFNQILLSASIVIQPKGPTHRNYAVKCIEQVATHAYKFTNTKSTRHTQFLLTYLITKNLNNPGYEIQEEALQSLHNQGAWSIEVLQSGRKEFKSYSENCNATNESLICTRNHVLHLRSYSYVMVVEDIQMFYKKLNHLTKVSSFNNEALYIIYYTQINSNNHKIAIQFISALYRHVIRNIIVIIPRSITNFGLYKLVIKKVIGTRCYSKFNVSMPFECDEGNLMTNGVNVFKEHEMYNHFQCFIHVQALPYEPFVISRTSGIETDIIHEIGKALNISFRIHLFPNATRYLGVKSANGTWTGFLRPIFDDKQFGIGNIQSEAYLLEDFSYSVGYHWIKISLVVPFSGYVPRWRVLVAIFKAEIWGICLAMVFGVAIAFRTFKTKKEARSFRTFEKCVTAAFQILLAHPVPMQPICNFTRVYFISLAIFAIIINSVYTSSLIFFLQNPIREHQISEGKDIVIHHMVLGGSPKYREMFKNSPSKYAKPALDSYQTVNESVDTYRYWLTKVAEDENLATIITQLCAIYLMSKNSPIVIDRYGDPKIFILPKPLRTQPIGILMRKGNFLENLINKIIQRLIIEAGLINKIKGHYTRVTVENSIESNGMDDDSSDVSVLSTYHLEGPFVILALGQACGLLALVLEIIYYHLAKLYLKKSK